MICTSCTTYTFRRHDSGVCAPCRDEARQRDNYETALDGWNAEIARRQKAEAEVERLRDALRICGAAGCPTATINATCGCGDSNCNDCAGAERP